MVYVYLIYVVFKCGLCGRMVHNPVSIPCNVWDMITERSVYILLLSCFISKIDFRNSSLRRERC